MSWLSEKNDLKKIVLSHIHSKNNAIFFLYNLIIYSHMSDRDTQMQDAIQNCYEQIKELVEGKELNMDSILDVIGPSMEVAEMAIDGGLSGSEKLQLVMGAINILIQESGSEHKDTLISACEKTIPNMISLLVSASRGGLQINGKTADQAMQSVGGCFACISILAKQK